MNRGIPALLSAAALAVCLAACGADRDTSSTGRSVAALTAAADAGGAPPSQTSSSQAADPPDPYGLSRKTTAELRAMIRAIMGSGRYYEVPADKRARLDSVLVFLARRRGYRPFADRAAYDPTAYPGVPASSLSPSPDAGAAQ